MNYTLYVIHVLTINVNASIVGFGLAFGATWRSRSEICILQNAYLASIRPLEFQTEAHRMAQVYLQRKYTKNYDLAKYTPKSEK